ncbi:MAG: glycosyltransferase family 2 protein [Rhodothermales bacterium]|nr:glycosyltransferase family 2 protein [Rhodothermales bacterium]
MDNLRQDGTLCVILPVHDEREVLPATYDRLVAMRKLLEEDGLRLELLFIDDGSRDGSGDFLDQLTAKDNDVRIVHLTRNFGHQAAVTAGLELADADVVAVMDSDLQDPPEVLPEFLRCWREGFDVVYGIRRGRKESALRRFAYWSFYRLYHTLSDPKMPTDSGDFCLLDCRAVDLLNSLPERQRFVRGLRTWIGLKQIGVEYERAARPAGVPSYTIRSLIRLATDGLLNFSTTPLRLATRLGLVCMLVAIALGLWVIALTIHEMIYGGDTPRGWASLATIVAFLSSVQLLSLGIIGEYLNRIFLEIKGRPTYLIGSIVGGGSPGSDHTAGGTSRNRVNTRDLRSNSG